MQKETIQETLACFHGTQQYHVHQVLQLKSKITDGIHFIREECKAYWLLDAIYSYYSQLATEEFQVWVLEVLESDTWLLTATDGNSNILAQQEIVYSDFPLDSITIWLVDGIAMLPSEY